MMATKVLYTGLILLGLSTLANAQVPTDSPTAPAVQLLNAEQAWKGHKEVEQCAWCHYQLGTSFASRPTDFCQLNEARHWLSFDPHATSRLRIEPMPSSGPVVTVSQAQALSRRIVDKLGYNVNTAAGYQKFCENCLTCHAGYQSESLQPQQSLRGPLDGQPGISCVYCHQVQNDSAWIDLHGAPSASTTWRLLPPHTKQSHGMRHLAAADAQARLCYQCHIGDLSQNMFVSHAMYVAGHPPLPSVELSSLTEATSPHWRSSRELYTSMSQLPNVRDKYFATHLASPDSADKSVQVAAADWQWQTQATALGAVQAQLQLLTMMEQSTTPRYSSRWADYALYDCAGCHHGLQSPSWRQQHRLKTPPGRPLPVQWSSVLEQAITHTQADTLNQARAAYLKSITAEPFGDRAQVSAAARSYRIALESIQASLARSSLQPQFARSSLKQLSLTPPANLVDAESARQLVWGAVSISHDLMRSGALSSEAVSTIDKLRLLEQSKHYDPAAFFRQVEQWRGTVRLP